MAIYSARGAGAAGGALGSSGGIGTSNGRATVLKPSGFNRYGQATYSNTGTYNVYIVRLGSAEKLSSIRSDTSASKSTIDEELYDGDVQMPAISNVAVGDGLIIESNKRTREFRVAKATDIYGSDDINYILVSLTRL